MIEFACRCSLRFSLPEDQAGGVLQCPQCHRLVDVPFLSDLEHIDTDGNFKFQDDGTIPLAGDDPNRLTTLHRTFTRDHFEADGSEIDLRPTMEDVLKAGTEIPLNGDAQPAPPKYDPITGELVRPIDVKSHGHAHIPAKSVPMAKRAIEYAGAHVGASPSVWRIGTRLLEPVNLFVMSIIVFVHVILQPVNLMMAAGIFLVAPLFIIGAGFILSHYGNVVEEMGPGDQDELPRPLRDAELHADIWKPFTNVFGSILLSYSPAILAHIYGFPVAVIVSLCVVGTMFFPALLLTLSTSGSPANLRPDRVMGVIKICGGRYGLVIAILVAGVLAYGLGLWRFQVDTARLFLPRRFASIADIPWWFEAYITYPAFVAGVYLMHWFCWSLGALYRANHERFPWILQRHTPTRLRERTQLPPAITDRRGNTKSAAVKQRLKT